MAIIPTSLCLVFIGFMLCLCSVSQGYNNKLYVGGRDGWVINPSENYGHWAHRMRFQVNDTLVFKFKKGEDSVLLVTRENYDKCNVNNPIKSLTEEESEYKFESSGPHFFISGKPDHCNKGQKIITVVLAVRPKPGPVPALSPPPTPSTPSAEAPAPEKGSETPVLSPSGGSPSPSPSQKKDSGALLDKASVVGVVLSVVIGVNVFLGGI